MLDHASISVNDFKESLRFYDETLKLLGYERVMTFDVPDGQIAAYGTTGRPYFWVGQETSPNLAESIGKARGFHLAFQAPSIEAIHAWYQKCLELGGKDNGAPGPRPEYHPGFYGAFIVDPNGWRIEATLHHYQA